MAAEAKQSLTGNVFFDRMIGLSLSCGTIWGATKYFITSINPISAVAFLAIGSIPFLFWGPWGGDPINCIWSYVIVSNFIDVTFVALSALEIFAVHCMGAFVIVLPVMCVAIAIKNMITNTPTPSPLPSE